MKCEECDGEGWVLDDDVFDTTASEVTRNDPYSSIGNYSLSDADYVMLTFLGGYPQPDGSILDLCAFCDGFGDLETQWIEQRLDEVERLGYVIAQEV